MIKVNDVYKAIDEDIPFSSKESWDNCGLLAGSGESEVTKAITALDITADVIEEAKSKGAELIISHHPIIFSPLKAVDAASPVGMLLKNGISAICTHTPFDMAEKGMNKGLFDILSAPLGLNGGEPLDDIGNGLSVGMIYDLDSPLTVKEAAERAKAALGCSMVRYTKGHDIRRIAVSSGSGNSFVSLAAQKGADALLSGDFKHDALIDAGSIYGIALIDCGHFYTERIFCGLMKEILSEKLPSLEVIEAESCKDPAEYIF